MKFSGPEDQFEGMVDVILEAQAISAQFGTDHAAAVSLVTDLKQVMDKYVSTFIVETELTEFMLMVEAHDEALVVLGGP